MNLPEQIVIQLLKSGLGAGATKVSVLMQADAAAWKATMQLSARQGVLAITYDAVQQLPMELMPPKEVLLSWAVNVDRIEQSYAHRHAVLEKLAAFYAAHNIPITLLKGAGLASLYPTPSHRPCGDIDIWLHDKQAQADDILTREMGIAINHETHHHTVFTINGVMIENHYDFLNCSSHHSNRELEGDLRRYAQECGSAFTVGVQTVQLPAPDFNALFLMRHMAVHFAAVEIGLRHIADWAMFLRTDGAKVNWEAVRAIYKEHHMLRFADAVTALCVEWMGVNPKNIFAYEEDKALQTTILNETLSPAFAEKHPKGFLKSISFKVRRWWANRWKHPLVYKDSLIGSFFWLCWAHLTRPKTITN
ncbi:MAG: nucleotidyltransferase family protein [Alistipes sp.]